MIDIKPKKNYLVALESVAMTDIVLNMFIFFFISFSILYTFNPAKISKIDVRLPKASSVVSIEGAEKAVISINRRGEYFIGDDKIKAADLEKALSGKLKENASLGVMLKVDDLAKFDSVVRVLDVINALKIEKVSVAAFKKGAK
ncbi:MAG: biopolymer transporter ExbD [Candidatus Omnitrophica bacterium]|nr:biopolymer transporter ExbD [Candidatus Omnitrophota bacterium]MDD5436909.1 biopolymer transporter ExbD [Candidatus Omnitrophota bacterium]